jgi:hypothetical protein
MRRRGGAPSSTLQAAAPPPPPPGPDHLLANLYQQSGGWMAAPDAKKAMSAVDEIHGKGVGQAVHMDLVNAGVIRKQRARQTTYHWSA